MRNVIIVAEVGSLSARAKMTTILISRPNSVYIRASNFRPSPNFSKKALHAFAQLLPPCIHCQEEGCFGKYAPLPPWGSIDLLKQGFCTPSPKGEARGPRAKSLLKQISRSEGGVFSNSSRLSVYWPFVFQRRRYRKLHPKWLSSIGRVELNTLPLWKINAKYHLCLDMSLFVRPREALFSCELQIVLALFFSYLLSLILLE